MIMQRRARRSRAVAAWYAARVDAVDPPHPPTGPPPVEPPGLRASPCPGVRLLLLAAATAAAQPIFDQDQIDLTGQQNLTLGAGARAYGMGGAFLARADDATAASWNPAGLSYLRTARRSPSSATTTRT